MLVSTPRANCHMSRKNSTRTPDQVVADLTAKLARAKNRARSARTHRLCQFGGAFDSIIDDDLLAALALVPADKRAKMGAQLAVAIRTVANETRTAAA